jgi:hypothetical protein
MPLKALDIQKQIFQRKIAQYPKMRKIANLHYKLLDKDVIGYKID